MKLNAIKFAAAILCAAVVSTGAQAAEEDTQSKVLRVGCETAFAPFTYTDHGELIGFDLDLIRAMAKTQGYEVEVRPLPFDGVIPALMTDNIDLIISGFTITPERAQKVDFSDPYYRCGLTFLVRKEDADKFNTLEDLKDEELCLQLGTSGSVFVQKQLPNAKVKHFNSPPETYLELTNGGCRAVINDRPVNDFYLAHTRNTNVVSKDITSADSEYYGIAVRKGNQEMLDLINTALKAVEENGEFERISNEWFGYDVSAELRAEGK